MTWVERRERLLDHFDRLCIPVVVVLVCVGTYTDLTKQPPTGELIRQTSVRLFVLILLWRIIHYLKQHFREGQESTALIKEMTEDNFGLLQGMRKAAEALATTLEIIYDELTKNTRVTEESAKTAAELALTTAATLASNHRASLAEAVKVDQVIAERTKEAILMAVSEVHKAADQAYNEANHVNIKISDLNERVLTEQRGKSGDVSSSSAVEASLDRIDAHTAAIERNTASLKAGLVQNAADIKHLEDKDGGK